VREKKNKMQKKGKSGVRAIHQYAKEGRGRRLWKKKFLLSRVQVGNPAGEGGGGTWINEQDGEKRAAWKSL